MNWEIVIVILAALSLIMLLYGLARDCTLESNGGLFNMFVLVLCFVDVLIISLVVGG